MVYSTAQNSVPVFDEVAITDFNQFQIAVLTTTQMVNRYTFSASVPVPERIYQTQGWLICDQKIVAHIEELKLGFVFSSESPFSSIGRLAPSIPVSFEVKSSRPLPIQLHPQAAFVCEVPDTAFKHHAVFREISPRFVRLYPFCEDSSLLEKVRTMLKEEKIFIAKNYERLRHIPFYQKNFGLQVSQSQRTKKI